MSERGYGIIGTILVHNIILLILLFTFLILPEESASEGALIINFGDMEVAGGPSEPERNDVPLSQPASSTARLAAQTDDEAILTQDFEEAPAVNQPAANNVRQNTPVRQETTEPVVQESPVEEVRLPDPRAMYTNRGASTTESGTAEGIYQGGGNMGNPQGSPDSDNFEAGLTGSSIGFSLEGRSSLSLPKPEFKQNIEGIVVVTITVDRNGNVTSANPGARGSTTADKTLYDAAREAALKSRFNIRTDAPERQVGTITYHFQLQ